MKDLVVILYSLCHSHVSWTYFLFVHSKREEKKLVVNKVFGMGLHSTPSWWPFVAFVLIYHLRYEVGILVLIVKEVFYVLSISVSSTAFPKLIFPLSLNFSPITPFLQVLMIDILVFRISAGEWVALSSLL